MAKADSSRRNEEVNLPHGRAAAIEAGSKRYQADKPCIYGHTPIRYTSTRGCIECCARNVDKWRKNNPGKERSRNKRYKEENKERAKKLKQEWIANNNERHRAAIKNYYQQNKEERLRKAHEWREANREWTREYARRYAEENREARIAYRKRRREYLSAKQSEWARNNRDKRCRISTKRRAAKMQRSLYLAGEMAELNDFVIDEAYGLAKDRGSVFGFRWDVDHIYPLQGEMVSGLHIYSNIRVIPSHINQGKGNRLVYMKPFSWAAGE